MKRITMAAAAIAALSTGFAGVASATTHTVHSTVTINAWAPAECHIHAKTTSVNLDKFDLIDHQGFVKTNLSTKIADKLNDANITAWCNGNNNKVVVSRTPLVNTSTTTAGAPDLQGFDNAVIYDVEIDKIGEAKRIDGFGGGTVIDGSEDGAGNGPIVTDFGATGHGSQVHFASDTYATAPGYLGSAINSPNAPTGNDGPDSNFGLDGSRIAAGKYVGAVTVTLTPGV